MKLVAKPLLPVQPVRYYGKYRGVVMQNVDPMMQGRVQAVVREVGGDVPLPWAAPCVPYVSGTQWTPPPIGAGVWIEFEQGIPELPIWSGCYSLPAGEALFGAS